MMCRVPAEAGDVSEAGTYMARRLSAFMRTLRDNAFAVGLKEGADAAQVLASPLALRRDSLRSALKALVCACRSDWLKFDAVFDAFWLGRGVRLVVPIAANTPRTKRAEQRHLPGRELEQRFQPSLGEQVPAAGSNTEDRDASATGRMEGATRAERLAETDFRRIHDPEAIAEAHALAARLARRMRTRLSRRERARLKGRRLDLRRTIRRNVAHGGVPLELVWRRRKRKPLRLVVLLDTSGSMSLYTSVFVRFIHGVLDHFHEAEAFLFHTRLVHVSAALRERDAGRALDRLSLLAQGVGGGTRIGESLATFNRWHAKSVIHSRTCVMIVSDGYDTGTPEAIADEMRRLARRAKRIVWLNPMIGWDGYAPSARGMQAALPFVDLFAPAHNLKSLAALEPYLARL
jgi:uncharacterized protein with von Willebrand factor type A (vWA) domain